jgi:hypothetical protein
VDDGTRTHDGRNHNPGLYQLSYVHHCPTTPDPEEGPPVAGRRVYTNSPRTLEVRVYSGRVRAAGAEVARPEGLGPPTTGLEGRQIRAAAKFKGKARKSQVNEKSRDSVEP